MSTKITASGLNSIRNSIYQVLGPVGAGYGAGLTSGDVYEGQTITTSSYYTLVDDLRRCWIHQKGSLDGFPSVGSLPNAGNTIPLSLLNTLTTLIANITLNAYTTPPASQLAQASLASSTSTIYNGNDLTYRVDYTFLNTADVNYFFNLGGRISAGLAHASGTYVDNAATWVSFIDWANARIGSISYTRNQWVAPTSINASYTSGTNIVRLGIFSVSNTAVTTVTSILTVTNTIGTVSVPTTATSYITYSVPGPAVDEQFYGIASPIPQARVITSFGSGQIPPVIRTKILTVDRPSVFTLVSDSNTSLAQSITIRNRGNTTCTVSTVIATNPDYYLTPEINGTLSEIYPLWKINPGSVQSFILKYLNISQKSVGLIINDVGTLGGWQIFNYGYWNNNGSLSPTTGPLWTGYITGLYSHDDVESGLNQGTYLEFSESQSYTGPYYITYRGTTYKFSPITGNDSYTWVNADETIFSGYGLQKPVTISLDYSVKKTASLGTYYGNLSIYSDAIVSPITTGTQVTVIDPVFDFYLTPDSWNYTYTYRDNRSVTLSVIVGIKDIFPNITYGTDGNFLSQGFSIKDSATVVGFDISFKSTSNGTYTTTVNIGVNGVTHPFTATIVVDILPNVTRHLGHWVSALQRDNGVIGASYDIINGSRYITLGFGMGADGSGNVVDTRGANVNINNLGIGDNADPNFALGPVLYPGPSNSSYSDFLKPSPTGHGVWVNDSGWSPVGVFAARTYTFTAPRYGNYTYTFAADNQAYFTIGNNVVGDLRTPRNGQNTTYPVTDFFSLTSGVKTLTLYFYNANNGSYDSSNNPGAVALTITDPNGSIVWDSNFPIRRNYTAYQYWKEVYRIPLYDSTATDAVFYSKNYIIKNLNPLNGYSYGSAFGYAGFAQEGSMFTIIQDPYNNITITLNPKYREFTDKTTNYASYLFYYYTGVLGDYDRPDSTQLELNRGDGQTLYFTGFDKNGTVTTSILPQPAAPYIPPADSGGGGSSVSANAYMPYTNKMAGTMLMGDSLLLLTADGAGTLDGTVISNRISQQKLLTLVSSSGIRLTCSDNTPLTLQDGSSINSTEAVGNLLPVQDKDGFRWEEIVEVIDAGTGNVATIFCNNQCYAAGDEPERWIWTHNVAIVKS